MNNIAHGKSSSFGNIMALLNEPELNVDGNYLNTMEKYKQASLFCCYSKEEVRCSVSDEKNKRGKNDRIFA